jgi:hypothetical protein
MSGVIVIVGVNGDDYQLILKNNYKSFGNFRLPQPNTCNTKIVSSVNPGRIQNK